MARPGVRVRLGPVQVSIILGAAFTAGVHGYLAVSPSSPQPQLRPVFLMAALGFLAATGAAYAPLAFLESVRWPARIALLGLTAATIVAYLIVTGFVFDALALIDKSIEAILIVMLVVDVIEARRTIVQGAEAEGEPRRHQAAA